MNYPKAQFTISKENLRGLTMIAKEAVGDVRYYLAGVCIDCDQRAAIVTNSHILVYHAGLDTDGQQPEPGQFIIPFEALKAATTGGRKSDQVHIICDGETITLRRFGHGGETTIMAKPIDAKFPEYHRVIPKSVSYEPGTYDLRYLAILDKALGLIAPDKKRELRQNDTSAGVVVTNDPDTFGVIMPMRPDDGDLTWSSPRASCAESQAAAA